MRIDMDLRRDVLDELEWEPSIDAAEIGVTSHKGIVTLTGDVKSYAEKLTAERVTKRIQGVKAIANDIERPLARHCRGTDSDIARMAVDALNWSHFDPGGSGQGLCEQGLDHARGRGRLAVPEGRSVRRGTPPRRREGRDEPDRLEAARLGDRGDLSDRSGVPPQRRAGCEVGPGGDPRWQGDAARRCSFLVRAQEAERTAWAAPGVTQVENLIAISP